MAGFSLIQCKICDKFFQSQGRLICADCLIQIDKDFIVIRDYIYDHPGSVGVEEISEATEVSEKIILHLIKEKRLSLQNSASGSLSCEICRRPISGGRFCKNCGNTLSKQLMGTLPTPVPEKKREESRRGAKMHIDHGKK